MYGRIFVDDKNVCPKCNHNKFWMERGETEPQYGKKCSKCGFIIN